MKMTLSKKLYSVVGSIVFVMLVISGLSWFSQHRLVAGYAGLAAAEGAQELLGLDAENELGIAIQAYRDYLLRGDEKFAAAFKEHVQRIDDDLEKYAKLSSREEERNALNTAMEAFDQYQHAIDSLQELRKKSTNITVLDQGAFRGVETRLRIALEDTANVASSNHAKGLEELGRSVRRVNVFQLILTIGAAVFGIVLSVWVIKKVLRSIDSVRTAAESASVGNLATDIAVASGDEVGHLAESFNRMVKNLRSIVSQITGSMASLVSSSEQLTATSQDISKGAQELSAQTDQVATTMTEVSQTIMDMAKNASNAADASKNASDTASKGKKIVDNTAEDMTRIAQTVQVAATTIEGLGRSSAQIGEIVATINGIADQTNLLALNAAIEAARAGEQGRGFAVVADEVRKLAERTAQATKDIAQRIQAIQQAAAESVEAMKKGSDEVDRGVGLAKEASSSMDTIVSASNNAMEMVQRIAAATEQQSAATEEVTRSMEHISGIAKQSAGFTGQIEASASELAKLASALQEMTTFFKH